MQPTHRNTNRHTRACKYTHNLSTTHSRTLACFLWWGYDARLCCQWFEAALWAVMAVVAHVRPLLDVPVPCELCVGIHELEAMEPEVARPPMQPPPAGRCHFGLQCPGSPQPGFHWVICLGEE